MAGHDRRDHKSSRHHHTHRYHRRSSHDERPSKKRRLSNDTSSNLMGMGQTLEHLRRQDLPSFTLTAGSPDGKKEDSTEGREPENSQAWQTVGSDSRGKKQKKIPKRDSPNYPSLTFSKDSRLQAPIKISDLQGLILYLLADGAGPHWIAVKHRPQIRKVVALMVPGLERDNLLSNNATKKEESKDTTDDPSSRNGLGEKGTEWNSFLPVPLADLEMSPDVKVFADMFEHMWPVKTSGDEKYNRMHSPMHAMLTAPLPKTYEDRNTPGTKTAREPHGWQNKRTAITEYLSSPEELLENDYTLHPAIYSTEEHKTSLEKSRITNNTSTADGWVDTKVERYEDGTVPDADIEKGSITAGREIIAMDCEMCKTGEKEFSLTRISLVSWDGTVIVDELVKPEKPIIDYLTMYSGITEEMLAPITTTLQDIQKKLLSIFNPKTILVGHSLNADLTALKITHPFIIDTALLYPHPRGPPLKSSLKWLAKKYLNREIQKGHGTTGKGAGHDSIEDSRTCLDLVKQKCEKGPLWGTSDAAGENLFKRLSRTGVRYKNQGSSGPRAVGASGGKSTAAIDWGDPSKGAGAAADVIIGCRSDEEVTRGVIRAVKGDDDGSYVPGGGVDFVWARLRELESLKGWWNNNKALTSESVTADIDPTTITNPLLNAAAQPADPNGPPQIRMSNSEATALLAKRIHEIYVSLPPCTAFIVYSGSGDPRDMSRLQAMYQTYRKEYETKKWDQLSVKWTDVEEQALKAATKKARSGLGFVTVK